MITAKDIPGVWKEILHRAQSLGSGAVLAGGALRDLEHGKPVRDLDIFIPGDDIPSPGLEDLDQAYGVKGKWALHPMAAYRMGKTDVVATATHIAVKKLAGVSDGVSQVQLYVVNTVILKEPLSVMGVLERMDFGACQIGFDGRGVWATYAYCKDHHDKTLTLCRCEDEKDFERSMRRAEKLKVKYPDYSLVTPWQFRKYDRSWV